MNRIEFGDCRETMRRWASEGVKVQTCVTSPPYYGLRDYGNEGQIGLEQTPQQYVDAMVEVFACVRDVMADDGVLWLNLGDSWVSKQLEGIPWQVALALKSSGWFLRQEIIWDAPNRMPEAVTDRCSNSHEHLFLLAKSKAYYFDHEAIKEPVQSDRAPSRKAKASGAGHAQLRAGTTPYDGTGDTRNRRSVWRVATKPYSGAHFAVYPPELIEPCIKAGSRPGDIVLDPFMGSGTTAQVAIQQGRQYLGCELNPEYGALQQQRIREAHQSIAQKSLFEQESA